MISQNTSGSQKKILPTQSEPLRWEGHAAELAVESSESSILHPQHSRQALLFCCRAVVTDHTARKVKAKADH